MDALVLCGYQGKQQVHRVFRATGTNTSSKSIPSRCMNPFATSLA